METATKTPKKRGRKSKLDPEVTKTICEAIERGNTLKNAAALAGVSEPTFFRWMQMGEESAGEFRDFREQVNRALANSQDVAVKAFVKAFGDDWRAAQEYLSRRHPEEWAKRDNLKVDSKVEGTIKIIIEEVEGDKE